MSTITTIQCDICTVEIEVTPRKSVPVKFTTEQTEGRSVIPYIAVIPLDICNQCLSRVIDGQPLIGSGARHDTFSWRKNDGI